MLTRTLVWLAAAASASHRLCELVSANSDAVAMVAGLGDAVLAVGGGSQAGARARFVPSNLSFHMRALLCSSPVLYLRLMPTCGL